MTVSICRLSMLLLTAAGVCVATASAQEPDDTAPTATVLVGAGVTTRSVRFAAIEGQRRFDPGVIPALGLQVGAHFGKTPFFDVLMAYQSSVFGEARQDAPSASTPMLVTTVHSHRLALGVAPGIRLGDGADSPSLSLLLGYGLRAFGSVAELRVPRYTMHGPLARATLELPLLGGKLVQRVAPELQLIVSLTRELRTLARAASVGPAIGGEASARVHLTDELALQLSYRESHALLASSFQTSFADVERFVMLDVWLRMF
jgi:hypothetical protein